MPFLRALGCYLPTRVVDNAELAPMVGADPSWLLQSTGIEQRRFAAPEETVAVLGIHAAKDCLAAAGIPASEIGMVIASSGSAEQRFPGPASTIAAAVGIAGKPAIDLPMASAGSLFGLAMAAQFAPRYGHVLVVASEIMSRVVRMDPAGRDTAILFGDGAGACLVSADSGFAEIADFALATDGDFAETLRLDFDGPLHMDGRTIILQASRKLPRIISELLDRNQVKADAVGTYLLHQANLNLITRVAQALGAPDSRFFRNIARYGNTSSASMLIAATEWWRAVEKPLREPVVLGAFGAGLNWGAMLCRPA
ncbi:MAG TPA: ketoacyl-ACP synthase III [Verrucomicrobiae bacterium]|nr:ketoacyl-ACP synthase III [Verrucomicrobiae bacterium]